MADEAKTSRFADTNTMISSWNRMYVLPTDLSYEPGYEDSIAGIAEAKGISVREALMDVMADRRPILFLFGKYRGNLEFQVEAIKNEHSVFGLSDGGAHCGVLCDASVPTYMLSYMTRGNWLLNYAQVEGIQRALTGMSRRASFESKMEQAINDLRNNYEGFEGEFTLFFPELQKFSEEWRRVNGGA